MAICSKEVANGYKLIGITTINYNNNNNHNHHHYPFLPPPSPLQHHLLLSPSGDHVVPEQTGEAEAGHGGAEARR